MKYRVLPALVLTLVIVLTVSCRLGAKSDDKVYAAAFNNISSTGPDTSRIKAINQPLINVIPKGSPTPLKNMFGVNGYEWNFLQDPVNPNDRNHIYESNMALVKSFSAVRHYLNWSRVETAKGAYTFSPSHNGSWDYDLIYQRCKQDGILVLADLKNLPEWMENSYPASSRDHENAPVPYGEKLTDPASYRDQAKMAFQFAARYGNNKNIDKALVKVDATKRWDNDKPNEIKTGLGLIQYFECGNEADRWWGGSETHQTAEQFAANLSAFYDGNMGKLGPTAGAKTADPNMQVVMGGLASADVGYVQKIIDWCKVNRGYKKDGSINLCFDVINYHLYSNNGDVRTHQQATTGIAPELSNAGSIANSFIKLANSLPQHPEVWVTEAGYDINQGSYQKAEAIGNKTALANEGDWIIRTSLFYIRFGVKRLFFYQLFDDNPNGSSQFATSGLAEGIKRRPAADYILQTKNLMGDYIYVKTISKEPLVDQYQLGDKTIYVLMVPDETGRKSSYTLDLGKSAKANIYNLKIGADAMDKSQVKTANGKLTITVTETPVFVEMVK